MFCPNCSQEQVSTETKFCSRCGFLLTRVIELIESGGELGKRSRISNLTGDSPRQKGIRQGLTLFLLSFLVVPIVAILTVASDSAPYGIAIVAILLCGGGLLRMIYALLLQSNIASEHLPQTNLMDSAKNLFTGRKANNSLPAATTEPIAAYVPPDHGNWRDTNDLIPASVTEKTTNLLNKEMINEETEK